MKGKKQLLWINLPNHQASFSIWGEGESERYIYCQGKTLISIHWASVSIKPTTFSEHFSNLNVFTYNNTITILFFWPPSLSLSSLLPYLHKYKTIAELISSLFLSAEEEKILKDENFLHFTRFICLPEQKGFSFFFSHFFFCYFRGYREFKV